MGRVADWLFGTVEAPAITAAGAVALAPGTSRATVPWGFGPPLEPFTFDGWAPPWFDRSSAMSIPAISRCRDLICSAVSRCPLTLWRVDTSAVPAVEQQIPALPWLTRPDPDRTRQWLIAWTVDDLFFYERAHWLITRRYEDTGYPAAFRRIPPGDLEVNDDGSVTVTDTDGRRERYPADRIVEFLSPLEGILSNGWRAISIALRLDDAADRFAATEVPAGVLEEQEGSEDMSSAELATLAAEFAAARQANTIAALNKYVRYREIPGDASARQGVEGRTYQALEMARLGNVPPYLIGAPAGTGMTYQNGQQARQDLIDFGADPYIGCIEQTLSGPNVNPRGQAVRFDLNVFLRNPLTTDGLAESSPNDLQIAVVDETPP